MKKGCATEGREELPHDAVREAIVNAVCHRDYASNACVQVMLFRDRLEIINSGCLPKGTTIQDLLVAHDSNPRNHLIARAMSWTKIVESSAAKTRRAIRATVRKAVGEIRTNAQSEYDRRGSSSSARASQVRAVVRRLAEFKADENTLPASLRGKHSAKWIHQACRDVWTDRAEGYSDPEALYRYCHRNEDHILSLAGI